MDDGKVKELPFEIPTTSVNKDGNEEHGVEIWDGGSSADDEAPGEAHYPVSYVVL
jgi:hypothetical protein